LPITESSGQAALTGGDVRRVSDRVRNHLVNLFVCPRARHRANPELCERRTEEQASTPAPLAASIFLFSIQYWFVLIDFDANLIDDWTWVTYGPFLGLAVILFLAGGIVLPTPGTDTGSSLIDDFEKRGKFSLLFVAAYLIFWVPLNAWGNAGWLNPAVFINLVMAALVLIAHYARPGSFRDAVATFVLRGTGLRPSLRVLESDRCQLAQELRRCASWPSRSRYGAR